MISILKFEQHYSKIAIYSDGKGYSYEELLKEAQNLSGVMSGDQKIQSERVCFMVSPGFDYVKTLIAIWFSGGIAVPLCLTYPGRQLEYVIDDTAPILVIASPQFLTSLSSICGSRKIELVDISKARSGEKSKQSIKTHDGPALILYTSGTTSKPKGVLITHANIEAQVKALTEAWKWSEEDRILCTLPLHHIHGIVNIVCCALWSGACCEFLPKFDEKNVFKIFENGEINLFMAVPTIYYKLIHFFDQQSDDFKSILSEKMKKFRLMVSGSAALPVSVLEKWREISGHTLLERYGMTEIGMGLSNPYDEERRPGFVGLPLPGVEVRLVDEAQNVTDSEPGEIQVRGKTVFQEYWGKKEATVESFTDDGWFRTGDLGAIENGYFKILGRISVDIIKTGGYKVSALEIEEILRTHPKIRDCGVVGIDDLEWGERIVAALVAKEIIPSEELIEWLKERLPNYKVPRVYKFVEDLPRNAMGKVTKTEIKNLFA